MFSVYIWVLWAKLAKMLQPKIQKSLAIQWSIYFSFKIKNHDTLQQKKNIKHLWKIPLPMQEIRTLQIPSFILFLLASISSQTSFSWGRGCPKDPGNLSGDTPTGMPFSPSLSCSSGNTSSVFSRSKSPGMGVALAILKMWGEEKVELRNIRIKNDYESILHFVSGLKWSGLYTIKKVKQNKNKTSET